jgi:hypothetical protein
VPSSEKKAQDAVEFDCFGRELHATGDPTFSAPLYGYARPEQLVPAGLVTSSLVSAAVMLAQKANQQGVEIPLQALVAEGEKAADTSSPGSPLRRASSSLGALDPSILQSPMRRVTSDQHASAGSQLLALPKPVIDIASCVAPVEASGEKSPALVIPCDSRCIRYYFFLGEPFARIVRSLVSLASFHIVLQIVMVIYV